MAENLKKEKFTKLTMGISSVVDSNFGEVVGFLIRNLR